MNGSPMPNREWLIIEKKLYKRRLEFRFGQRCSKKYE